MGYSALKELGSVNKKNLGIDSPKVPERSSLIDREQADNLCLAAGEFIRSCEGLEQDGQDWTEMRHYEEVTEKIKNEYEPFGLSAEDRKKKLEEIKRNFEFHGKSMGENQIPISAQKDFDRLVFENAIYRFCESGSAEDAFDIYYCYLSIFFGDYRNTREIVELLAEFETNGGSLLLKHRDHYSHSVYVFLIGLAVFQKNKAFRNSYRRYYLEQKKRVSDDAGLRCHFLKFWGLTSLFHDIGYPFELPFEQIKGYFSNSYSKRTATNVKEKFIATMPFVAYKNLDDFLSCINVNSDMITQSDLEHKIRGWAGGEMVYDFNDIFALHLAKMFTRPDKYEKYMEADKFCEFCRKNKIDREAVMRDQNLRLNVYRRFLWGELRNKPKKPDAFDGYIDHAYFSAILMMHKLNEMKDLEVDSDYTDALCAIILHNSLFKRSIINLGDRNYSFEMDESPLAYLLMLSDELQCWDRISYGQNNRNAIYAMGCEFEFDEDQITAAYIYDEYFTKNKRIEFYEWMKENAMSRGLSIKAFYEEFQNMDGRQYQEKYKNLNYKEKGKSVIDYFQIVLDNPKDDLPEKMNDYLKMSVSKDGTESKFMADLKEVVNLDGEKGISLSIKPVKPDKSVKQDMKKRKTYLSTSGFLHLFDFACALNYQYQALSAMAKTYCKAVLLFISESSMTSAPVFSELVRSKSEKIKNNNKGAELKIVPVNVDPEWSPSKERNLENWIYELAVKYSDEQITEDDLSNMENIVEDELLHGNDKIDHCGEIAVHIYKKIFEPLGGSKMTIIPKDGISTIEENLPDEIKNKMENDDKCEDEHTKTESAQALTSSKSNVLSFSIYGESMNGNQSDFMILAIGKILKRHPDVIEEAIKNFICLSDVDYENEDREDMPVYFNICHTAKIDGRTLCIGTSFSMKEKLKFVAKVLKLAGEEKSAVQIDGYELPDVESGHTSGRSGKEEEYSLFGERMSGNQSEMMWDVFQALSEKYPDKIEACTSLTSVIKEKDVENPGTKDASPVYFRSAKRFEVNGVGYYVGTSYGRKDKLIQIEKMLALCNAPEDAFKIKKAETAGLHNTKRKKQKNYDI